MTLPSTSLYKHSHWCCDSLYYLEADPRSHPAHWVHQEIVCITVSEYFYPDTFSPNPLRPCGLALYSVRGGCCGFLVWRRLWFCTLISCVGELQHFFPASCPVTPFWNFKWRRVTVVLSGGPAVEYFLLHYCVAQCLFSHKSLLAEICLFLIISQTKMITMIFLRHILYMSPAFFLLFIP